MQSLHPWPPVPLSLLISPRAFATAPAPLPALFSHTLPLLQGTSGIFRGELSWKSHVNSSAPWKAHLYGSDHTLSLNNPVHCKGGLFSNNTLCGCVSKDLDIKQLKLLWMSGMPPDPDLVKKGRALPPMLTWLVIGSSPCCSLGYSWLLDGHLFQLFLKD